MTPFGHTHTPCPADDRLLPVDPNSPKTPNHKHWTPHPPPAPPQIRLKTGFSGDLLFVDRFLRIAAAHALPAAGRARPVRYVVASDDARVYDLARTVLGSAVVCTEAAGELGNETQGENPGGCGAGRGGGYVYRYRAGGACTIICIGT